MQSAAPADPDHSLPLDRLRDLHEAAERVRICWEKFTFLQDRDRALPSGGARDDDAHARRYIAALWQVQSAEEDYLRLREQFFGA